MKKNTHPAYHSKAKAHCACGASYNIGSTNEITETEICAQCHPFYTGKEKVIDTLGQVQKFKNRMAKKSTKTKTKKS